MFEETNVSAIQTALNILLQYGTDTCGQVDITITLETLSLGAHLFVAVHAGKPVFRHAVEDH